MSSVHHLDSNDADFVDIVHTDAGGLGYRFATGHADFWANGGVAPQPGCFRVLTFLLPGSSGIIPNLNVKVKETINKLI